MKLVLRRNKRRLDAGTDSHVPCTIRGELVADLAAKRPILCEAQVMSIARLSAADQRMPQQSSPKRISDSYSFNITPVTHVIGEKLSATERTGSGDDRRVPVG